MKTYLVSNIPILTLKEKYANCIYADFLMDDIVEVSQDNDTCIVDDLNIAMEKLKTNKIKFIYELNIKEVKL